MSHLAGISGAGRNALHAIIGHGQRFVSVDDAAKALGLSGREAAKKLAAWASRGWLRRVRRGLYIPVPVEAGAPSLWSEDPLLVADAIWAPCYFTGWTAAAHWALTDQIFRTTVLRTTKRVRAGRVKILDHTYLASHVDSSALWSLEPVWREERKLLFADPARAVADILDDPRLAGGIRHAADIVSVYLERHDSTALVSAVDRIGNRAAFKRLGYLAEQLAPASTVLMEKCRARLSTGIAALEPGAPRGGKIVARWGLRVNATVSPPEPS